MAMSQCWLAVVSCSICLSTSATERLQAVFLRPHTTLSRPISTRCNSEFRSLQLSNEKRGHGSEDSTYWGYVNLTQQMLISGHFQSYRFMLCSETGTYCYNVVFSSWLGSLFTRQHLKVYQNVSKLSSRWSEYACLCSGDPPIAVIHPDG